MLYQLYRLLAVLLMLCLYRGTFFIWQVMLHANQTVSHDGRRCSKQYYSNLPWLWVCAFRFKVLQLTGSYSLYLKKVPGMFFLQLIDTLISNKHVLLYIKFLVIKQKLLCSECVSPDWLKCQDYCCTFYALPSPTGKIGIICLSDEGTVI